MVSNDLSKEKFDLLRSYIEANRDEEGMLMPTLQRAQEIFGYLGEPIQQFIADEMGMLLSEVYGVATFYSQFALEPEGKHSVSVCLGTACYVRGAQAVLDALTVELDTKPGGTSQDGLFTLKATRCLGCCGLAPVMMIGEDVYGSLSPKDVPDIIKRYRAQ